MGNVDRAHCLVVLGNGFDLACGLRSGFADFFTPRMDKLTEITQTGVKGDLPWFAHMSRETELTAWDIVLEGRHGDDWADVESAINEWINSGKRHDNIKGLCSAMQNRFMDPYGARRETYTPNTPVENQLFHYLISGHGSQLHDSKDLTETLVSVLVGELRKLENALCKYLKGEVDSSSVYQQNSEKLLSTILKDEARGGLEDDNVTVLTFNYTIVAGSPSGKFHSVNIHGTLDNSDIIVGVDGSQVMEDPVVLPFTKTYRVMSTGGRGLHEALPGSVSTILFFGHSLAQADYSYFQAIFDYINLYAGDTRLVFYYRPYASRTIDDVRTEMMERVIRLLTAYGKTLDNRDHGNNLIHKLLLEGRLAVKNVDVELITD